MSNLYDIIKLLQNTSSTNEKKAILEKEKDNSELQQFILLCHCPTMKFNIGTKTFPAYAPTGNQRSLNDPIVLELLEKLKSRQLSGTAAITALSNILNDLDEQSSELLTYIVLGDSKTKVGVKTFNKIWKGLLVDIPYNRCSLISNEVIERLKNEASAYLQLKGDGTFGSLVNTNGTLKLYTRNGSEFPDYFTRLFSVNCAEKVLEGEIVWYKSGSALNDPLPREIGNGITNSILNGSPLPDDSMPLFQVWNLLDINDWNAHKTKVPYSARLKELTELLDTSANTLVELIPTHIVSNMAEVNQINNQYLSEGREGTVLKFKDADWGYNTNKSIIKIKVAVDIDMEIVSIEEATGKNAGMAGRINVKSSDGKVFCGINATGTEAERIELWTNRANYVGKIIETTCNDVISSNTKDGYSLFLGRGGLSGIRFDKDTADDLPRINEIFESIGIIKNLV